MTLRDVSRPKHALLDAALIAGAVVGANLLFDRGHPGWTNLNPTPYLLLPILLGGRYGFTVGLLSGLAASLLTLALQVSAGASSFAGAFGAAPYTHTSLIFTGGICGELFGWFRHERAQANAQLDKLQTSVRRLDADVRYLRGVKDELDRAVAARDGEVSTLDAELRRLYATPRDEIPSATLQFLRRQVRVADAAIYGVDGGGESLGRLALIGRDAHLPVSLERKTNTIVRLALERGALVTLPMLLQQRDPPADEPLLLTMPLKDAQGRVIAVLAVAGMPFINFNAQTVNLIALICDWAGEVLDLATGAGAGRYRVISGREAFRIFSRDHFRHLLALSLEANQRHRLPSSVVLLTLRGAAASEQARFEQVVAAAIRGGDYAAELGHPEPHLAVLLPLVGERGAAIFIERCRQFVRHSGPWPGELVLHRIEIGRATEVDDLMRELDEPVAAPVTPTSP